MVIPDITLYWKHTNVLALRMAKANKLSYNPHTLCNHSTASIDIPVVFPDMHHLRVTNVVSICLLIQEIK